MPARAAVRRRCRSRFRLGHHDLRTLLGQVGPLPPNGRRGVLDRVEGRQEAKACDALNTAAHRVLLDQTEIKDVEGR